MSIKGPDRARRRLAAAALLGAALGASLTGCATDLQDPDAPEGVPNYIVDEEAGADAALAGRVAEIDGCFYVQGPAPERILTLAVFPAREVTDASEGSGFAYLGEDYADGDAITVGGSMSGSTLYAVPEACDEDVQQWRVAPSTPAP
ncbi:hypothetical protein [Nesterenkonia sp. Act20]|uniref:hypothetical protein n=1 Tax=Nesterenkonia sp. Act20 TaxID=1483432 RepID=UPI001C43B64A|nr:hypothetical protein [Nesterenkonia sp. Act20]